MRLPNRKRLNSRLEERFVHSSTNREEDFADQVSEQVMLQKAMQCLKPEQREVLDLSYFHGLKAREIAYVTGEKTATVKSRIRQGLKNLKTILEEEGYRWNG